jgi:hypothetical protein
MHSYGGSEVLEIENTSMPALRQSDEVLVAVVASSINPVDIKFRTPDTIQQIPQFPFVSGWDMAGIVIQAQPESGWQVGDRVIAMTPPHAGFGAWAEVVAIPGKYLVAAPTTIDLGTAAALPLAGATAQQAVRALAVQPGEKVLVTGAIGAVGGLAVQMFTAVGCEVTGLVSTSHQMATAMKLGATFATSDIAELGQFDVIFDTAGVYELRLVGETTRCLTISDLEGPTAFAHHYVQLDPIGLAELVEQVDAGQLRLRVARRFPLAEIRQAHEFFEAGGLDGKVIISF